MYSSALLADGKVLILTSEAEHCDKYCVLILSALGIKKAAVYACSGESTTSVNKWGMDYYGEHSINDIDRFENSKQSGNRKNSMV